MRPSIGQRYSVAEFITNTTLSIVDLSGGSFDVKKDNITLNLLANKISQPNTDNNNSIYHITQHMAHILKQKGYDGIKYKSSQKKGSINILLFNENNVDFVCSDIITVNNVFVDYYTVLPCKFTTQDDDNNYT